MKSQTKQEQNLAKSYRSKKPFSAIDCIIIATLLVAIVLCLVFTLPTAKGDYVIIFHEGKEIGRYLLKNDNTISIIENKMTVIIKNGNCYVKESDCKNQICVDTGKISKAGERIVCTPNKVTIIISSSSDVIITGGVA